MQNVDYPTSDAARRQLQETRQLDQRYAADNDQDAADEQGDAELNGQTVLALARGQQVRTAEDEERPNKGQANQNVDNEHLQSELIGVRSLAEPFKHVDGKQINAGDTQHRCGSEDEKEQDF